MTRKKVKLAYISNDTARKATFKKRKKGLMKKVSELSTLCGVDACAIIYSPYDAQPEVWPSAIEVQRVLSQFKNMPEMEQSKKMVNQESFLRQRIGKANEQLKKQRKDNREKEVTQVMFQSLTGKTLNNLNMMDLNDLGWIINQYLKDIYKKVETVSKEINRQVTAAPPPPSPPPQQLPPPSGPAQAIAEVAPSQQAAERQAFEVNMEAMQRQQWIMDLINPHENMGFIGDEMMLPFGDHNHNSLWSNAFFP
ncbi:agamous-like MADS-box protein AGL80 [Ricinus communis]|uniref:Mads box protein, putative n=1 Tax=Ricinus communis TaxID=3988 RepID=B9S273_RICCO|nr:agamous-like MADS-box protein AGL80 [Ricinus communis]EEF42281.1 mads box protein, putative [Ricinus communis]|eukprot:XP_002520092.1 agamous-like MADS-box protein AGL80 [Ricinus communis]